METVRPLPATQGLGALDLDRAHSLADEGGVSAAAVEARGDEHFVEGRCRERGGKAAWRGATLLVAGAFGILAGWKLRTAAWARLRKAGPRA